MDISQADRLTWGGFLQMEAYSRDTIDVKRCYIDIAGDIAAGVLLSQIIYWNLPDPGGQSKLTVVINGQGWLARRREDWWDECRLTPKQFDKALSIIEATGVVTARVMKYQGTPIVHIRLNRGEMLLALQNALSAEQERKLAKYSKEQERLAACPTFPNWENGLSQNGNIEMPKLVKSSYSYKDLKEESSEGDLKSTCQVSASLQLDAPAWDLRQESLVESPSLNIIAPLALQELKPFGADVAEESPTPSSVSPLPLSGAATDAIKAIFAYWQVVMESPRSRLDDKRRTKIKNALGKLAYTEDEVKQAILGCSKSDFNMGREQGRTVKYNDITLILRDAEHIDRFIHIAEQWQAQQSKPNARGNTSTLDMMKQWEAEKAQQLGEDNDE